MALIAVWGYIAIRQSAQLKAEKTDKNEVPKLFEVMLNKFGREELQRMLVEAKMTIYRKNTNEVFQKDIDKMFKDPTEVDKI